MDMQPKPEDSEITILVVNREENNETDSHIFDMKRGMSFSDLISPISPANMIKRDGDIKNEQNVAENKTNITEGKETKNNITFNILDDIASLNLN